MYQQIFAEVKTDSPFGFHSEKSWEELFKIAEEFGDAISVHTDPRWNGSWDLLKRARQLTDKPILAKGIHAEDADVERAVELGADHVLVVGRLAVSYADQCIIEPTTLEGLQQLPNGVRVVWNSRDLTTGGFKSETFAEARKVFPGWLCQASNIITIEDIDPSADAVLVGANLPQFVESFEAH